jgi:hypothetical protein
LLPDDKYSSRVGGWLDGEPILMYARTQYPRPFTPVIT